MACPATLPHSHQTFLCSVRGIGLGLVKRFLQRDNTVVATTRKPAEAEALQKLAQQQQGKGKLMIKLLDTSCEASVTAWAAALAKEVSHVDVSQVLYPFRPKAYKSREFELLITNR